MITYTDSLDGIVVSQLTGFFVDWLNPASPETHLRLLRQSAERILAIADACGQVIDFSTAIGDGVLSAYIPLLEVLPAYHGQSFGSGLVRRMLDKLRPYYMVDLLCDPDMQPFYERLSMRRASGML